jgi:dTDP-4-amino-4,6-dideoxygalactose transaminase
MDLAAQHRELAPAILEAIQKLVADSSFIGGPALEAFERGFAAAVEAPAAVGAANGTSALALALRASDLDPGAEVVTTASTFIATAEAIVEAGARPVLVDIDPETALMDLDAAAAAVGPRTRAIVGVHLYGTPLDLERLSALCARHGLALLQDAAQAHGARWAGRPLAAYGAAQTYSFFPGKNLGAWGDAGAVCSADPQLVAAVRALRDHGREPGEKYLHQRLGGNHRLDALQALVLSHKLPTLAARNEARRRLYRGYRAALAEIGDLRFPSIDPRATPVHHLFVVRSKRRDALAAHLKERGIQTGVHYPVPLQRQPALAAFGAGELSLPHSEALAREALSLPFYPELDAARLERVVEAVREFFGGRTYRASAAVAASTDA